MAVLWFVLDEGMYGFPAYNLANLDIIRQLGGEASFKFLCRLDRAPERARGHNQAHVATYDRVLLELTAGEARSVAWRAGFYEVQQSREEVVAILGEPNIPTEGSAAGRDPLELHHLHAALRKAHSWR